ncbi:hypothetical protein FS837_003170 [Tulasnella sp. UAMH 9824]|nr:hypothetical protein FS837_003170 [Tulasnella sp. UAMH 9824]
MALKAFQNAAVTSTPDAAVVVVILDRTTILGSELVAEYAGDGPTNNKAGASDYIDTIPSSSQRLDADL